MRKRVVVAVVSGVLVWAVGSAAAASAVPPRAESQATPLFPTQSTSGNSALQRRPGDIYVTPSDGEYIAGRGNGTQKIRWTSWGANSAVAPAELYVDGCGCAADTDEINVQITLVLSAPRRINGALVFSKMTYEHPKAVKGKLTRSGFFAPGWTVTRISYDHGFWTFG